MKTVCSISGGQSSAYIAANYPADYRVFSLVTIEDRRCTPKDKKLVQIVSDRIGKEFIATAEDDTILHTILDLEQYIGQRIDWVNLISFDEVCKTKGGWLPNKLHRYCTVEMKLRAIFRYWKANINEPVEMQIGFRANEQRRAKNMLERANSNGLLEFKDIVGKHKDGRNKWDTVEWQKPVYPLIDSNIYRDNITAYWKDKPVRFAALNNCVGCFHRNPLLLKKMFILHPEKMRWFTEQEENRKARDKWRSDVTYKQIQKHKPQAVLDFDDLSSCDTGYCGL
tara:strand:+ start:438 stop:1283 length:846 start_codon:yes stop_codon:yes gene_type:complete